MRIALVILLVLHGIAHMPGFLASWQLMTSQDVPYKTTILNGLIDLGDGGIKLFGLLWVVAMLAFLAAAWMLYIYADGAKSFAVGVVIFSLLVCIAGLPEARIGVAINVALLAFFALESKFGWLGT